MTVRDLPALLMTTALGVALTPHAAIAQIMMGPGIRTEMTPSDREAHNGVFDHVKRGLGLDAGKATVNVGEVRTVARLTPEDAAAAGYSPEARPYSTDPPPAPPPADREPRPKRAGAPVNSSSEDKSVPPGSDPRQVRPAEAFPPERIQKTPQAPARAGPGAPAAGSKDDPRGVEERKDPGG